MTKVNKSGPNWPLKSPVSNIIFASSILRGGHGVKIATLLGGFPPWPDRIAFDVSLTWPDPPCCDNEPVNDNRMNKWRPRGLGSKPVMTGAETSCGSIGSETLGYLCRWNALGSNCWGHMCKHNPREQQPWRETKKDEDKKRIVFGIHFCTMFSVHSDIIFQGLGRTSLDHQLRRVGGVRLHCAPYLDCSAEPIYNTLQKTR